MPPPTLRRYFRVTPVVALLALALPDPFAPPAAAQQSAEGAFSISPSRRDLAGRPPAALVPTQVTNTTKDAYAVRAFPVLLRQGLTGAFDFSETPRALNAARRILPVSPSSFTLPPGASRRVALRWELLPRGARAAYVGVVFQGQPQRADKRALPSISRLLSVNFLRLPGRYRPDGAFTRLTPTQAAPRVLRLLPRIKNTGDIVAAPKSGRVAIRDAQGRAVFKGRFKGDLILPGAQREFAVDVDEVLPAGRYTARAAMRFGASRNARISTAFELVGPNELPTPAVRVIELAGQGDVGEPARVSGRVQSFGTAPVGLDLRVSLFRVTSGQIGARPLSARRLRFPALAPKSERPLDLDLPGRLTAGPYRVVARYTDPTGAPQEITSDFAAAPRRSLLDRFKLFVDRNTAGILIGLVALLLLALVLALLRRQRRLTRELRAARAATGADE